MNGALTVAWRVHFFAGMTTDANETTRVPEPAPQVGPALVRDAPRRRIGMAGIEEHPYWAVLARIPLRLTAEIPLPRFKVKDLLGLKTGQLVMSAWGTADAVPLTIGGRQVCWSEFDAVGQRMAVRVTRLA